MNRSHHSRRKGLVTANPELNNILTFLRFPFHSFRLRSNVSLLHFRAMYDIVYLGIVFNISYSYFMCDLINLSLRADIYKTTSLHNFE
jgi:hypothetical protein